MKKVACLFPGQGSQAVGMGKDFYEAFPVARHTFEEADDLLSFQLCQLMFEGPDDVLTQTRYSQLALFVHSTALFKTLKQHLPDLVPSVAAGLSLGEYTALCASGRIEMADALRLVQKRANFMNQCCEETEGAMAAVLGPSAQSLEEALKGIPGVWVANYNCPGQIVISGTKEGVQAGSLALKAAGAKKILPLTVHGAFHSGLMQTAQQKLAPFLREVSLKDSTVDFVMNVPGDFVTSLSDVRQNLIDQVTHSVRWEPGILEIERRHEVELYVEIGSGKTLTGMNRKIGVSSPSMSLEKVGDLDGVLQQIEGICSC